MNLFSVKMSMHCYAILNIRYIKFRLRVSESFGFLKPQILMPNTLFMVRQNYLLYSGQTYHKVLSLTVK